MWYAGVDIGSISAEVVIVDGDGRTAGYAVSYTGANSVAASERTYAEALERAGVRREDVGFVVGTGYGRARVPFADAQVTEITCHGRGAAAEFPGTRTVVDIGGQDSKAIKLDATGRVLNFQMNDKCAAGTGRFLEVMARALEVDLEDMGKYSLASVKKVSVSSVCTVFAESEVVGLIHQGMDKADIIRGIHAAIADRTRSLVGRVGIEAEITMTGGVAKNPGVVAELTDRLGQKLNIPSEPQIIGALGAALIARERANQEKK